MNTIKLIASFCASALVLSIFNLAYGFSLEDLNPLKPDEYTQIDNCIKNNPSDQIILWQIYYCTQGKGYSDESILRYCIDHTSELPDWERENLCRTAFGIGQNVFDNSYKNENWYKDFLKSYQEAEREQKLDNLGPDKDCPATQHVHSGKCMDNQDGKAHGRTDNASRSSRLDCGSNEFACKSSGEMN